MLIEQLIDLKKVRTDNLKFRKDLRDLVMPLSDCYGWLVSSQMGEGWKTLSVAIVFQVLSTIQGKKKARNVCNLSSEALQSL